MKNKIKNYGLDVNKIIENLDNTHYLAGATSKLPTDIIQADINWEQFVPKFEPQSTIKYDTDGCTVFGTYNALEGFLKKLYGGTYDFAERFTYILAGIRPPGGDPHKVAEIIRSKGMIEQNLLPLTNTYEEFIQPDPIPQNLLNIGAKFIQDKTIGNEWLFTNTPNDADKISMLKWGLQRGVVCISITAWYKTNNGLFDDNGQPNTHWVWLINIKEKDGKFYPVVYDSYDENDYIKTLTPTHKISLAKRYVITPKTKEEKIIEIKQQVAWYTTLLEIVKKIFSIQTYIDNMQSEPQQQPIIATTPFPEKPNAPKYLWDTKENIRHSIRVICDEEGLSVNQKNELCATVQAESGFNLQAKNENFIYKKLPDGTIKKILASTDYGLCQINDYYHIGQGKSFPSVDFVLNNPEVVVRWMCKQWKEGNKNWWIAYKNESYKRFL